MTNQKRFTILFVVIFGWPASAQSNEPFVCNGAFSGETDGDVLVGADDICLMQGATVNGDIEVQGELTLDEGTLVKGDVLVEGISAELNVYATNPEIQNATKVKGSVLSDDGASVDISGFTGNGFGRVVITKDLLIHSNSSIFCSGGAKVKGDVLVWKLNGSVGFDRCKVLGDMQFLVNTGSIQINNDNEIYGDMLLFRNSVSVGDIDDNEIFGDLTVVKNLGGAIDISNNNIDGDLKCKKNDLPPDGGQTNIVGGIAKKQCKDLIVPPTP